MNGSCRFPHETDPWGSERAFAFRFWTDDNYCIDPNTDEPLEDCADEENALNYMGGRNIQYKNAILILDNETRQVLAPSYYINSIGGAGIWDFYRVFTGEEINDGQKVEVVVAFEKGNRALEVCIVGVDYPSYEAFKEAVLNNTSVSSTSFTTSKGDVISTDGDYNYGLINGQPIWGEYGYPIPDFPLLTTYDKDGNKMISWDWDTKRLTLCHGGQTKVYDYKNWTTSPGSDPTPEVCDSDVNNDGRVDVLDLQLLINCQDKIQPAGLCLDLNGDQRVDEQDIQSLIEEILIGD